MPFILERLAARPDSLPGQAGAFDLKAAVGAQIQRMVSAQPIDAASDEMTLLEFGMPSIVELAQGSKTQLERYAMRLTRLIRHYEPRLLQPKVMLEPAQGKLTPYRLIISGGLMSDEELQPFQFELFHY